MLRKLWTAITRDFFAPPPPPDLEQMLGVVRVTPDFFAERRARAGIPDSCAHCDGTKPCIHCGSDPVSATSDDDVNRAVVELAERSFDVRHRENGA